MSACIVNGCSGTVVAKLLCSKHYSRLRRHGSPTAGRTEEGYALRAMSEALSAPSDKCILLNVGLSSAGYATAKVDGRRVGVHRLVCEEAYGPAPFDLAQAAHKCGVRNCINPAHLYWATPAQNAADAVRHGTDSRGERHGGAKLDKDQVRKIRKDERTHAEIARAQGVSEATVWAVKNNRTWRDV